MSPLFRKKLAQRGVVVLGAPMESESLREGVNLMPAALRDAGVRRNGPSQVGRIAAEALAGDPGQYWLHVDLDVLSPAVMPAVDDLLPGGLDWDELTGLLRPLVQHPALLGMDVTIYNPAKDPGRTLEPRIVRLLADVLGTDPTA